MFGEAQPKGEGQPVNYGVGELPQKPEVETTYVETTYVERRVPNHLEDEAHELIDNWLKSKGYDPEEI